MIMATYVMSDLHGCRKEFNQMLDLIQYSTECDELWIVGDICDRGNESIPLLQQIADNPSMHIIFGNHDVWLEKYASDLILAKKDCGCIDMTEDFVCWLHSNGGYSTADQFMDLSFPQCHDLRLYLEENRRFYQHLNIHGRKFLLVHAGLGDEYFTPDVRLSAVPEGVLVWAHIGIDDNPFNDTTMIVGHTPTFCYGNEYSGRIIHGKNDTIYHIDCGCVYGKALGCLRLDDMQEFYVPSSYPSVY